MEESGPVVHLQVFRGQLCGSGFANTVEQGKLNPMKASDNNTEQVLLIGDIEKAFLDSEGVGALRCRVCPKLAAALDACAKTPFAAVAVVVGSVSSDLGSALKVLRQQNRTAKILLLARMYEEPLAMQLTGAAAGAEALADDYLICPVATGRFYEAVTSARYGQVAATTTAGADARIENRIRHLEKLATEDDLTGLKNRRYIREFSTQIIERAARDNGRVTLLLFDVDNLKSYNDTYGHLAGDEILKQAAVLMRHCCRTHDVIGRIGGDEFAVLFWYGPQVKPAGPESERRSVAAEHPEVAISIVKRFQKELEKAELGLLGPKAKGVLTISGGLASFPRDGSTPEELFRKADEALLEAKRNGKNKIYLVGRPEGDIADIE